MTQHERKFHRRDFAQVTGWALPPHLTPFVVPDLERDSPHRLVLTTTLAKYSTDPELRLWFDHASRYWQEVNDVADAFASHRDLSRSAEFEQLCSFSERPELRTGHCHYGHSGRGIGDGPLGARIRDTLVLHPGLRKALIAYPDCLQLVPNIAGDRVTDALGTILLADIVRFTRRFNRYFDRGCLQSFTWTNVYDGQQHAFGTTLKAVVPSDDRGRPILLLPKALVRGSLALDPADYVHHVVVGGRRQLAKLDKEGLLQLIGFNPEAITHFAAARLDGIRPHQKFQTGTAERRPRRRR